MGLKVFGDPRASRLGVSLDPSIIWLLYFLENYCRLYTNSLDKVEHNFLKNLRECLKVDLISSGLTAPETEGESREGFLYSYETLILSAPLRNFTGVLLRRADIWDAEREASRSNFSEYGSSSSIKRLNKSCYRVGEWEFGLRVEMSEGALLWGQNLMSPPLTMPTLKNYQVLAIAAGSYHVVFITEEGVFGWG